MEGDVFTRMPEDILRKFAEQGVNGAKKELYNRSISFLRPSSPPIIQRPLQSDQNVLKNEKQMEKEIPTTTPIEEQRISSNVTGRRCADCGDVIPQDRITINPRVIRCTECQGVFERTKGYKRQMKSNEGIAGSRKDNKRMRSRDWGDMRNRSRG